MFSLPTDLLGRIPALLIAITFHEYAHGRMAYYWGDPTAKLQGRLTLNPLAHLILLACLCWLSSVLAGQGLFPLTLSTSRIAGKACSGFLCRAGN